MSNDNFLTILNAFCKELSNSFVIEANTAKKLGLESMTRTQLNEFMSFLNDKYKNSTGVNKDKVEALQYEIIRILEFRNSNH